MNNFGYFAKIIFFLLDLNQFDLGLINDFFNLKQIDLGDNQIDFTLLNTSSFFFGQNIHNNNQIKLFTQNHRYFLSVF